MKQTRSFTRTRGGRPSGPGVSSAWIRQAARLEWALDDLDAVALDELVVAGDVVAVGVGGQEVRHLQALALDHLVQGSSGPPLSTNTAVPPGSSATRYAFESHCGSMLRSISTRAD